jgi:hypothetical protein
VPGPVLTNVQADESDSFVIGLRENTTPQAWSLMLIEAEEDPDDKDLGLSIDSYGLVTYPGQATTHGGVLECELRDTSLRLRLTTSAAEVLGLPPDTTFPLDVSPAQMATLRHGLRRVFASGTPGKRPRLTGLQ